MGVGVQLQQDITTASSNNLLFGIIFSPIHLPLDGFNQHNKWLNKVKPAWIKLKEMEGGLICQIFA